LDYFLDPALVALVQVVLIDIVLAGDNAVVIGMAAANVAPADRGRVIFWGLVAAVVLRIGFAVMAAELLSLLGLMLAGGVLLLWVAWRLYRDLREAREEDVGATTIADPANVSTASVESADTAVKSISMRQAIIQVTIADVSMSLDNVLAVAGAAMDHVWVLAIGLVLSIALMGIAAAYIARLLQRYPWVSYAGLVIVLYVAFAMIWRGTSELVYAL